MSQHYFITTHDKLETIVTMGWDRPLQGYFMFIEKESDKNEPFWLNLNEREPHPKTLNQFLMVLDRLGIFLPVQMIDEVWNDGINNCGNKYVWHNVVDGKYQRNEKS